jgi:hypothetical protein
MTEDTFAHLASTRRSELVNIRLNRFYPVQAQGRIVGILPVRRRATEK